nr:hypothetical protein [Rubrivivax pictus]
MFSQPGEQCVVDLVPLHQRVDQLEQHEGLRRPQRRVRPRAAGVGDLRVSETHAARDRAHVQLPLVVVAPGDAGAQDQRLAQRRRQRVAVQQAAGAEQSGVDHVLEQALVARHGAEQHRRRHAGRQQAREARGQRGGVGGGDGFDAAHAVLVGCRNKRNNRY